MLSSIQKLSKLHALSDGTQKKMQDNCHSIKLHVVQSFKCSVIPQIIQNPAKGNMS